MEDNKSYPIDENEGSIPISNSRPKIVSAGKCVAGKYVKQFDRKQYHYIIHKRVLMLTEGGITDDEEYRFHKDVGFMFTKCPLNKDSKSSMRDR